MKHKVLLQSKLILFALLVLNMTTKAQDPSFSVYIANPERVAANVYEFDVVVKASGPTSTFQLRTFQGGLWVNPTWISGGSIALSLVSGQSQLAAPSYNGALQWNATNSFINMAVNIGVKTPSSCIATTVTTADVRVARVRMTNTASFDCNSTPDLKFNYIQNDNPLRLRSSVSWRASGCSVNYDMFYPNRAYTGQALFNGELYSTSDADGRSPINSSVNIFACNTTFNLTAFLQGYYIGGQTMEPGLYNAGVSGALPDQADTVTIQLRSTSNTGITIASATGVLKTNGTASFDLPGDVVGNNYWLVFKHRNSIETWSKNPVLFGSNTSYNFSTGLLQAYDDSFNPPMQDMGGGVFAIYGGDINQDGTVDALDMNQVELGANAFLFGYDISDATGDGATDALDMNLVELNSNLFLFAAQP